MTWDLSKLHAHNLTMQLGPRATVEGLTALVNPKDVHIHRPTKHVFFQGRNADASGDGHIHEFWWDGTGSPPHWQHNDVTIKTGAPLANAAPSSYMFMGGNGGKGTKHVMYEAGIVESEDHPVIELWWDGDWHANTNVAHNAPLGIGGTPFGYEYSFFDPISQRNIISQRVVYHTLNHRLHLLVRHASGDWQHTPLPSVPDVLSRPTAYAFTVHGQTVSGQASQRVLFTSPDGVEDIQHVRELTWNEVGPNNQHWVLNDLTSQTGAPPLGSGDLPENMLMGLMHDLEFTLHVFYGRNQDQRLYELHFNELGWHVNDLTSIMAATPMVGGQPLAYVHVNQGTLNVQYVGIDGHIHALSRDVGQQWNPTNKQNLTMPIGAPPPLSQPVGFVFRDLTQHLFYIANNSLNSHIGDIIELTDE